MNLNDIKERLKGLEGRLMEDELYRIVWEEIQSGHMDPTAQARSLTEGEGEDAKIRAAYIKHRVRRLQDEIAGFAKIERELEAEKQREKTEKDRELREIEKRRIRAKYLKYITIFLSFSLVTAIGFFADSMNQKIKEERKVELERVLERAVNRCDEGARLIFSTDPTRNSVISVGLSEAVLRYWNIPLKNRRYVTCIYSVSSDSARF